MRVSPRLALGVLVSLGLQAAGAGQPPLYSRADGYPQAPAAVGLPAGPSEIAKTHPGLYADYQGEMFGEGAYYLAGPQQPMAPRRLPPWAGPHASRPALRLVAIVRTDENGRDAYDLAARMKAEIVGVPVAFSQQPEPPRGARCTAISMKRLHEALAGRVDVILVNRLIRALPDEAQQAILDKVEAGAGLLVVGPLEAKGPLMARLAALGIESGFNDKTCDYRLVRGEGWLAGGVNFDLWPGFSTEGLVAYEDYDPRFSTLIPCHATTNATVVARLGDAPFVVTGTIGKGRVVAMGYAGSRWNGGYLPMYEATNDERLLLRVKDYYEQMYSLLMKACIQAAGGAAAATVVWPEGGVIKTAAGERSLSFRVRETGGAARKVTATCLMQDGPSGETLRQAVRTVTLKAGQEATLEFAFDSLPVTVGMAGVAEAVTHVVLRDSDGRLLDWGTVLVQPSVAPTLKAETPEMVNPGERGQVVLETPAPAAWKVKDIWGRVVASGSVGAGRHTLGFAPDNLSGLATFTADISDKSGNVQTRVSREIYTPVYDTVRDYYNLLWPRGGLPFITREFNASVMRRQGGIDTSLGAGYYQRVSGHGPLRGGQRLALTNVGVRNPFEELAKYPEDVERHQRMARRYYTGQLGRYAPRTLHLQDERHSPPIDGAKATFSPTLLKKFRAWLAGQYGTVEALNREWLTAYTAFDQAEPTLDTAVVLAQPRSYARWLDFVRFVDTEIGMRHDLEMVDLLSKETGGRVGVGFEGIFGLYDGFLSPYGAINVPLFFDSGAKMNNMAYGIGTPMWELCASLNPEADSGTWLGYESERSTYFGEPWRGVLSGATFMGWFIDSLWFTAEGAVGERLSWVEQGTRPLRQGVGRLLIEADRKFDGVAILANMRSSQMAAMVGEQMDPTGKARGGHWMGRPMSESGNAMLTLCRDSGVSPAYITEGQVLAGRLKQFKTLCLVYDLSVDTRVAEAIRQWVREGGTLIADCGAGAANEHGRFLEQGQLDDVFGIRRNGAFTTVTEAGDFTVGLLKPVQELIDKGLAGGWYMVEYFETNLTPTTASAMGQYVFRQGAAQCFWNEFGKGRALYFGFLLNRYRTGDGDGTSVYPLFRAALVRAGVTAPIRLVNEMGATRKGYTITRFSDGAQTYVGLMKRDPDAPSVVTAVFPQRGHAYEVMHNRYLGEGDRFTVDLASAEPTQAGMPTLDGAAVQSQQDALSGMAMVALLPYRIEGARVSAEATPAGQPMPVRAEVKAAGGASGKQVLYLDVRDPDGNSAEPYCRNIVLTNGVWTGTIPLAFNEKRGRWTLTVREPISGITATTRARVR